MRIEELQREGFVWPNTSGDTVYYMTYQNMCGLMNKLVWRVKRRVLSRWETKALLVHPFLKRIHAIVGDDPPHRTARELYGAGADRTNAISISQAHVRFACRDPEHAKLVEATLALGGWGAVMALPPPKTWRGKRPVLLGDARGTVNDQP